MVVNLVPAMTLIVLIGSRVARARAVRSMAGGNGRLHVRLVALFSLIAAAPTLLVVIFASLLFPFGVDFWFSDRSRGMFENAASLAARQGVGRGKGVSISGDLGWHPRIK